MNARLEHSLVSAANSLRKTPPMNNYSSLKSNWNTSPSWNLSGTNADLADRPALWRSVDIHQDKLYIFNDMLNLLPSVVANINHSVAFIVRQS